MISTRTRSALGAVLSGIFLLSASIGTARAEDVPYKPTIHAASDEGEKALRKFRVEPGLKMSLFAAEPTLANPVAFCIDEKGRFFVAETFRLHHGVTDARNHMYWLDDDLASRTVADRVAMYKKYLGDKFASYGTEHDRIRLVEDRDGDGKADFDSVFADGFKDASMGLGAGVLARKGDLYYTNIPDLWKLRDTNGDGKADEKILLSTGYGVHVGFLGHDLHGLKMGPDGRLYFSIGDRGLNVTKDGKNLFYPDQGSVLRCEPDGSNLEVFSTGLRNPQELAFDEHGDLFTVDNNSDGGDRARLVHLVEGSDSGWRIGWQFLERPGSRGAWNAEKMWYPANPDQPAFLLPPLANISDGPSGLAYNPGTALNSSYANTFFLCDFRGSGGNSGIRSFSLKPKGASYELTDSKEFLWGILATDVDFGPDGALYLTDWVDGWEQPGKGRIYKLDDPVHAGDEIRIEVKTILAEGFEGRKAHDPVLLLGHRDMRVRQEAQFELAARAIREIDSARGRGDLAGSAMTGARSALLVSAKSGRLISRRQAIWGLGQVARKHPELIRDILPFFDDPEAEIRVQAARVLADLARSADRRQKPLLLDAFLKALKDPEPRVRFHAALGLAKIGSREDLGAVLAFAKENDGDPYLRHAAVMALAGVGKAATFQPAVTDASPAVRMAVLLAMRRQNSSAITQFLHDSDPRIVLEAARAINDLSIDGDAMLALGSLGVAHPDLAQPLGRRVIDANIQIGDLGAATRLAGLAMQATKPSSIRVEAIDALANWGKTSGKDMVTGLWHASLPGHKVEDAVAALGPVMVPLLNDAPEPVRQAAAKAAGTLKVPNSDLELARLLEDSKAAPETQVEALKSLGILGGAKLGDAVGRAIGSKSPKVRAEGLKLLAGLNPAEAIPALDKVIDVGTLVEKQSALATLAGINDPRADAVLSRRLDEMAAGSLPKEIRLDLTEAAARRKTPEVVSRLAIVTEAGSKDSPLAQYRDTLVGGDASRGRTVFREKAAAECLRCHKFQGNGGEVGPELTGLGGKKPRDYILESIVMPNAQIAQGFESVVLALADGTVVNGVLRGEDDKSVRLITAEGKVLTIPKADIEDRKRGVSAMPEDTIKKLTKPELRDLVEFLSTSK